MRHFFVPALLLVCFFIEAIPSTASAEPALTLSHVEHDYAGNSGTVSILIDGTGFTPQTAFQLTSGSDVRPASRQAVLSSTQAIATFGMNGLEPGTAGVRAQRGAASATLAAAFGVSENLEGKLAVYIEPPARVTAGALAKVKVHYTNAGYNDLPLPVLVVNIAGADFVGASANGPNLGTTVVILGVPHAPIYPLLRPSETGTVQLYVKVSSSTSAKVVAVQPGALPSVSLDYGSLSGLPADYINNVLRPELGSTLSEFYQKQIGKLERLAQSGGNNRFQLLNNVDGEWIFSMQKLGLGSERPTPANLPFAVDADSNAAPGTSIARSGDGRQKTFAVIVSNVEYQVREAVSLYSWAAAGQTLDPPDLANATNDGGAIYDLLNLKYQVPAAQISWLKDLPGDGFTVSGASIDAAIRALAGQADGDDNVVVYFSGLALEPGAGALDEPGTWLLNGGVYDSAALSAALDHVGAGANYVISESPFSGSFVDRLTSANTAGFAATKSFERNSEAQILQAPGQAALFTAAFTSALFQKKTIADALAAAKSVSGEAAHPSINAPNDDLAQLTVSSGLPFGAEKQWAAQLISPAVSQVQISNLDDAISSERPITVKGDTPPVSYIPGGLAVCPWDRVFYVTDNTTNRIQMINPYQDPKHRFLTLVYGLKNAGDIDVGQDGRSLVYVDDNLVKNLYFGFTVYVHDASGAPVGGAYVYVDSPKGPATYRTDTGGYLTVMDILPQYGDSRDISLTVEYQGKIEYYSFKLNRQCQTFRTLLFTGDGGVSAAERSLEPPSPESGELFGSGLSITRPPSQFSAPADAAAVIGGTTTVVPVMQISADSSTAPGAFCLTPAAGLITASADQPLNVVFSGASPIEAQVSVNGGPEQNYPVNNGLLSVPLMLLNGTNTISVKSHDAQGNAGPETTVSMTRDPSFSGSSGALSGRVVGLDGAGAAGVRVTERNSGKSTVTNAAGGYSIAGLAPGSVNLEIAK